MADFVVVGSGSGGAAVTRRLVDAGAEVALIEAGPAAWDAPELADPTAWVGLAKGRYDWGYDYAPTERVLGRTIPIPRGKALGGSSATNAMMWYRGHPSDYDAWGEGWSFAECLPAFRAAENWEGGASDLRGAGGPLTVTRSPDPHPLALAMIAGAAEIGIPVIDDPNGPSNEGAALANFNIAAGRRWSSADGYLHPILDVPNLTIHAESLAVEVLFDGDRATGVAHVVDGERVETPAAAGVILAAGAVETPRLLTLSGIAAEDDLQRLGLPCRVAAPAVGRNLQDHPLLRALNFRASTPLGPPRDNGGGAILNFRSDAALAAPDLHAFPVQGRSAVPALVDHYGLGGDLFAFGMGLMRSHSVGFMRVLTTDPSGPLELQPNFLADPRDLAALMRGVEIMMDLAETAAMAPVFAGFAAPDRRLSGAELETFVRRACSTFFHTCGTARMGADADAVTDLRLRVRGTRGLWLADASVIPVIPSCNTHAPVTMIGERAARFILEDA